MDIQTRVSNNIFYKLVEDGVFDKKQLLEYEAAALAANEPFDHFLVSKSILSESELLDFLSAQLDMKLYDALSDYEIPMKFMERVQVHFSRKYNLAAIGEEDGVIKVVTSNPLNTYALDQMEAMLEVPVELALAPRGESLPPRGAQPGTTSTRGLARCRAGWGQRLDPRRHLCRRRARAVFAHSPRTGRAGASSVHQRAQPV